MTDTSARHRVAVTSPPLALGTELNAIAVLFPPALTHLPIEALLVAGEPVGIRAAVARLTAPTTDGRARSMSCRWRKGESHSLVAIPAVMRPG